MPTRTAHRRRRSALGAVDASSAREGSYGSTPPTLLLLCSVRTSISAISADASRSDHPLALTNKERIGRCIELLRIALAPKVRHELERSYGDQWLGEPRRAGGGRIRTPEDSLNDAGALLGLVLAEWEPLFRSRFQGVTADDVRDVRDVRNEWAHRPQEEFTAARASELLQRIAAILAAAGCEADAAVVRFETASVRNSTVGESDRRLRAILIDTAAEGQVFGVAVTRGKRLGLSVEEVALATKALRASQLLAFDDPLTEASNLRLVG